MRIVVVRDQNPSKRYKFNVTYLGRKLQSRDRMWIPVGSERIDLPALGHAAWYNCNHRTIIHHDNRSVSDIGKLKIFKDWCKLERVLSICLTCYADWLVALHLAFLLRMTRITYNARVHTSSIDARRLRRTFRMRRTSNICKVQID